MEKIKTIKDVEIEIRRAVIILKALPREGPAKVHSSWPLMLPDDKVSEKDIVEMRYYRPMASEIDDMYLVLEEWLKVLNYDERMLVMRRSTGRSWKELEGLYTRTRSCLSLKYRRCIKKVYEYVLWRQNLEEKEK